MIDANFKAALDRAGLSTREKVIPDIRSHTPALAQRLKRL
jgi:hypothetical protein